MVTRWRDRPIEDHERPHLRALGEAVRQMRRESGLRAADLAAGASISTQQFWRISAGQRRTRRSTLGRMVAIAVEANPSLGPLNERLDYLCRLAGPALVIDDPGPVEPLVPPTEEEVRRKYAAWLRHQRAASRARRRFDLVDERYRRLTGDYANVAD